jgi:hypothetical protein
MRECAVPLPYVITKCFSVLYFLSRSSRFFRLEPHIIMQFNAIFGGGAADIAGKFHASIVIHAV